MAVKRLSVVTSSRPGYGKIHWRAPALMIAALLVGVAFAIGHDAFYRSLDRNQVRSVPYDFAGWEITQQQFNIGVGTAFAFAVKASLILAISTAYVQLFFRAIAKLGNEVTCIDSWFSGLSDITSLLDMTTFWRKPLLALVALTAWLLPIAAIVTPATLSIIFDFLPPVEESAFVPLPAFASVKLVDWDSTMWIQHFSGDRPNMEATRVVQAAAAGGRILPIPAPAINASWTVTTPGPRLVCEDVNSTFLETIKDNIGSVLAPLLESMHENHLYHDTHEENQKEMFRVFKALMFSYLSWGGNGIERAWDHVYELPFHLGTNDPVLEKDGNQTTGFNASEISNMAIENGPTLYGQDLVFAAALPRMMPALNFSSPAEIQQWNMSSAVDVRKALDYAFEEATVLRCEVLAANYSLRFTYDGPTQNQNIHILEVVNTGMSISPEDHMDPLLQTWPREGDSGCFSFGINPSECDFDTELLLSTSYVAVADLYRSLLVGAINDRGTSTIYTATLGDPLHYNGTSYTSKVMTTSLGDTIELAPLNEHGLSVLNYVNHNNTRAFDEAYAFSRPIVQAAARKNLKDAMEELFFNITISLASSPKFVYNISAPNAPGNVTIEINNMGNIYSYSAAKLWLAYGLAIGIALLDVLVGLVVVLWTGASFTLNFSTIVRAAKNADVSVETFERSHPGQDPLPPAWKRAIFKINAGAAPTAKSLGAGEYSSVEQIGEEIEMDSEEQAQDGRHQLLTSQP